jgi:DNA-binding response OmpR family regulator
MRILIIEDDRDVAQSIAEILKKHYIVDVSYTGKSGIYKSHTREYDLIIIDYILPEMNGLAVCEHIRNEGITTPIMFLTGHYHIRDKVKALNAGADDYVLKPFSSHELLARVRALMRRYVGHYKEDTIIIDGLSIDTIHRTVVRDERRIRLRRKAFDLLAYLARNKDRVLTRDMIMEHVWESLGDEASNTVDVHIKYLRDKIDKPFQSNLIKTVHGFGYKISHDES